MKSSVFDLIGKTPVIKLKKRTKTSGNVYVKLEGSNPGGSVKDRAALYMLKGMEREGLIVKGDKLVEPTSGNTGIGLAMVARQLGYQITLVMPASMSVERRAIISAFGASIILTDGSKGMKGSIEKARDLCDHGHKMIDQFSNLHNVEAHRQTTAREIIEEFSSLDAFVCGVGTGGTITGVGEELKKRYKGIQIIAVEPSKSSVLSGNPPGVHRIQGIGAGFIPQILNQSILDRIVMIEDEEALEMSKRLCWDEGLFLGVSSGANIYAALNIAQELGEGKNVLTISPDRGEKYITVY